MVWKTLLLAREDEARGFGIVQDTGGTVAVLRLICPACAATEMAYRFQSKQYKCNGCEHTWPKMGCEDHPRVMDGSSKMHPESYVSVDFPLLESEDQDVYDWWVKKWTDLDVTVSIEW